MATLTCPTCGRRFDAEISTALPFCSPRCRDVDLGRWLDEEMGLAVDREDEIEDGESY